MISLGVSIISATSGVILAVLERLVRKVDSYDEVSSVEGRYKLHSRYLSWTKQILVLTLLVILIRDCFLPVMTDHVTDMKIIKIVCLILALMLALAFDMHGVVINSQTLTKFWVVVYFGVLMGSASECIEYTPTASSILSTLLSVVIVALEISTTYYPSVTYVDTPPTAEYTSGLFSYVSFSYLNSILMQPGNLKASLEFSDVPSLQEEDTSEFVWNQFNDLMKAQLAALPVQPTDCDANSNSTQQLRRISIFKCLFQLLRREWICQGIFHALQSCAKFTTPLALQRILLFVSGSPQSDSVLPIGVGAAVLMLFVSPFVESFAECQTERIAG